MPAFIQNSLIKTRYYNSTICPKMNRWTVGIRTASALSLVNERNYNTLLTKVWGMRIIKSHFLHAEVCRAPSSPFPGAGSPSMCHGSMWACKSVWRVHVPQPPLRLGSTSSPSRQLSKSEKIGRSGNEGNKCWHSGKKKLFCCAEDICEWYCLLLPTAFFWNRFAFSRWEWSEVVKSAQSCKAPNLAQPDPSWGKTVPRFENANTLEFATMLCWSKSCRLCRRAEEISLKGNFISFPEHPR